MLEFRFHEPVPQGSQFGNHVSQELVSRRQSFFDWDYVSEGSGLEWAAHN